MSNNKKFAVYLLRWQLSTIVLYPCVKWLPYDTLLKTIIANLVGGIIFFYVDKKIFNK
jgi:fluoride ion exporter CrcB/FEX